MRPLTYQQARWREGKPICRHCFVPVDPRTREYKTLQLCSFCYDSLPPPLTKKKELVCPPHLPSTT